MIGCTRGSAMEASTGTVGATRGTRRRRDAHFFDPPGHFDGPYSGLYSDFFLPAHYHSSTAFAGIFPASVEAIRVCLPSNDLHPVLLPDRRGAVAVVALIAPRLLSRGADDRVHEVTPYAAVAVAALCTHGEPAPPGIPLLQPSAPKRWRLGLFVLHMPETTLEAVSSGRLVFNFPKFVADIDFVETPTYHQARVEEDGRHLLTVLVGRRGPALRDRKPQIYFTSRGGQLMRTEQRVLGVRQMMVGPSSGSLEFGDHPAAQAIRELDIADHPVIAFNYPSLDLVLPAPEAVGPARPYDGYRGSQREYGRWTITYPGSGPVDLYAHHPVASGTQSEKSQRLPS